MKVITLEKLKSFLGHLEKEFTAPFAKADASGNDIETTYLKVNGVAQQSVTSVLANRAEADADGNVIKMTYIPFAGGTLTGPLHVQQPPEGDATDIPATTKWVQAAIGEMSSKVQSLQKAVDDLQAKVKELESASSTSTEQSASGGSN